MGFTESMFKVLGWVIITAKTGLVEEYSRSYFKQLKKWQIDKTMQISPRFIVKLHFCFLAKIFIMTGMI
jgi:hypothetical protein